jgi:hypothetical protein
MVVVGIKNKENVCLPETIVIQESLSICSGLQALISTVVQLKGALLLYLLAGQ